jgi:hypothetical protein
VPLKQFLQFLELFQALKIKFEKKEKPIYRIGPSPRLDPTRPRPPPARPRPTQSPSGPGRCCGAARRRLRPRRVCAALRLPHKRAERPCACRPSAPPCTAAPPPPAPSCAATRVPSSPTAAARFAAESTDWSKPSPPQGPARRAAAPPLLLVAGRSPERRCHLEVCAVHLLPATCGPPPTPVSTAATPEAVRYVPGRVVTVCLMV